MLIFFKSFFTNVLYFIYHLKSTYAAQLRVLFVTFLFFFGIVYFIVIQPISLGPITYYLWIEVLFFVILLLVLIYGGVLYCFSPLKNSQIATELLSLLF